MGSFVPWFLIFPPTLARPPQFVSITIVGSIFVWSAPYSPYDFDFPS